MSSYEYNGLTVQPILSQGFGAEVSGIDWTHMPLPAETVESLRALQNKYGVIIFRNTGLDNARHVSFASQLGELEVNPSWGGTERVGTPYLFDVSNVEVDGSLVKKGTRRWAHALGNALWHTDSSFNQHRSKYSLLLAHRVPEAGQGNTGFADTRQAWKDLPESKKAELRGLIVEHDLWHSRRLAAPEHYAELTEEEKNKKPPAYHRLVQKAPNGGETFFIAAHAKRLLTEDGNIVPDSQKLIWDLIAHCTQPKYTFSSEWRSAGDMMWWDNRQTMHRASPYDENMGVRDVRRATVYDDGDAAFGVSLEETKVLDLGQNAQSTPSIADKTLREKQDGILSVVEIGAA